MVRQNKIHIRRSRTISLGLIVSLCMGLMLADIRILRTYAHPLKNDDNGQQQQRRRARVGDGLRGRGRDNKRVRVVLQLDAPPSDELNDLLKRNDVRVHALHKNFNARTIEVPASIVEQLADFDEVNYVSEDNDVQSLGHVTATTGADLVRTQTTTASNGAVTTTTLDGTGIGIAILDSGIYTAHHSFGTRVVYSRDFTGENRTDDPYGHGTHVAALAAGNAHVASGAYTGIAPNANLINLRVLDSLGHGKTSGLLSALDWVMTNRTTYNIRVVNMSLGTAAVDSYKNDPVCKAVRKLVDAGVVVVAAAGNNGKNTAGQKIYGQIHSPGNELSAITVGASNTFGTDYRNDDGVTTYSSRGPTRSYTTDGASVKHYDNLVKPDLVAPGNKIISAESPNNLLLRQLASLQAVTPGVVEHNQMFLNGTSMATPVVAGAAALLLQANPKLTPNIVKMLLMYTAQPLANFNTLEQGAGELNVEGAVRLAKLVRTDLSATTAVGATLLTTATAPTPQTTLAGQTFKWSQGVVLDHTFATGANLITKYQKIYGTGVLLSDGVVISNGAMLCDQKLMSSGVLLADHLSLSDGQTISTGSYFMSTGAMLGDGVLLSDGAMLSDGVMIGDGVMVSDGVMMGDSILVAQSSTLGGDNTALMLVKPDSGGEPAK